MNTKDAEFAILKVAFLLTAIDGRIEESERKMFDTLAARCREVDVDEAKTVLASVDSATKRMLRAAGRKGVAFMACVAKRSCGSSESKDVLNLFMEEVNVICDWAEFVKDSARVRRAFVMWTAMVMSDGDYSEIESTAISRLQDKVNSYKLIDNGFLKTAGREINRINTAAEKLQKAQNLVEDRELHSVIDGAVANLTKIIQG